MREQPDYPAYSAWSVDFLRAFNERPKLFQYIAKVFMGKHACKEMKGMIWKFKKDGWLDPGIGYGLEDLDYEL